MKILIAHEFVMGWRMMFGKIIGTVGFPRGPVEVKLLLSNAIFEPVVTHVKGFRLFHADLSMENAVSSGIVSLKWSGRLWTTLSENWQSAWIKRQKELTLKC